MFNKPTLFPKANEPQAVRSGRPTTGQGASFSPQSDVGTGLREPSSSSSAGVASSPASAATQKADAPKANDSSLIVGPDVKLKGAEILDCDTLVVEGRVEATMDSRVIRIAENGSFSGKVGIDVAEIHGQFDGELTARSQLIIHATGKVSGKIRYGKIFIEEGGEISGDIQALDSSAQQTRSNASVEPITSVSTQRTADAAS